MINRRQILGVAGAASVAALFPHIAKAAPIGRVVVVGGGMAGATAAKYLRLWSNRQVEVTLVEQSASYTSNIMSNLAVTGQVALTSLKYTYTALVRNYGIGLLTGRVAAIEPGGALGTWKVTVVNGATTTVRYCERVVLAPGIDFDAVPTIANPAAPATVLHAWHAGTQTDLMRQRLAAMPNGGTFIMSIPAKPYRCPPGPYERACLVADYLKRNKPASRVLVLDANVGITAEAENFGYAFGTLYGGNLTYMPSTAVTATSSVNGAAGAVQTTQGTFIGDVVNIIPQHRAGAIVQSVVLTGTGLRYAPVNTLTFESSVPGIHVLGDASDTGLPKAGHVGNQGAKICADAIIRAFNFLPPDAEPTANSACYSPVSSTLASWLTAVYQRDPVSGKFVIRDQVDGATTATEATGPTTGNFSKMNTWFKSLMTETYA